MATIENILKNIMNEPECGDSPLPAIHENLDVPNVDHLEVNCLNHNLIVLSDSFNFGES